MAAIKVSIDIKREKVLFAEANSDFADILISFLTLPLGTIVRLLVKKYGDDAPTIGSLNSLYKSLENLDSSSFWTEGGKFMLLNPKNAFENHIQKLKINIDDTEPTKYFTCASTDCKYVSMYYSSKCVCGKQNKEITLRYKENQKIGSGVFTTESSSFIISDDLLLLPNFVGSGLQILKDLGIEETSFFEEKTLIIGFDEIMDLLKLSFVSSTPLTDLFFHKKPEIIPSINVLGSREVKNANTSTGSLMKVKAIVQKSTGKVVLVQTRENFVDFLYSLLSIPLGKTLSLLNGDSTLGSVSNLYRSLQSFNGNVLGLEIGETFNSTQLPPMYLSKHQLLLSFVDPKSCIERFKGPESYIKGPAIFTVTDDLRVRPISDGSGFSILSRLKIPLSDVEEHDIDIGIDEALSILKATLKSTSVLSECFNPMLKKQLKKEK